MNAENELPPPSIIVQTTEGKLPENSFFPKTTEPDSEEVDRAFEEIADTASPIQKAFLNRARHRHAQKHNLPYRIQYDWKGIITQLFHP